MVDLSESFAENLEDHVAAEAKVLDSSKSFPVLLNGDSIKVVGNGATAAASSVTITSPGTYCLSGSLTDGQIIVDMGDGVVGLLLDGVDISSSAGPAIHVTQTQETVVILATECCWSAGRHRP